MQTFMILCLFFLCPNFDCVLVELLRVQIVEASSRVFYCIINIEQNVGVAACTATVPALVGANYAS